VRAMNRAVRRILALASWATGDQGHADAWE
jgi:hypothetical protein